MIKRTVEINNSMVMMRLVEYVVISLFFGKHRGRKKRFKAYLLSSTANAAMTAGRGARKPGIELYIHV